METPFRSDEDCDQCRYKSTVVKNIFLKVLAVHLDLLVQVRMFIVLPRDMWDRVSDDDDDRSCPAPLVIVRTHLIVRTSWGRGASPRLTLATLPS